MKQNRYTPLALAAVLAFIASAPVMAEDAPAAPAAAKGPTLSDVLSNSGISVQGYMDASYIAHNHTPNSGVQVFDLRQNSLEVHQAGITVSNNTVTAKDGTTSAKPGFSALLNLTAGTDSSVFGSYPYVSSSTLFDLTQGFVQYNQGPWTVIAGKFATLAGAEVIDSSNAADSNVTRSILFGKVPFTHTGVRATYALTDATNWIVGVNNGWDQVAATGSNKTAELGFTSALTKDTSLAVSGYSGTSSVISSYSATTASGAHVGNRSLVDAVLSTNLTPNLTLILNADVGQQENMTSGSSLVTEQYHGVAGYLNYKWSDPLHTSLRVERFIDEKGVLVSYNGQVGVSEMTFTVGYTLNDHFEVRGELRGDRADKAIYSGTGTTMYQTLTTAGIQALYRF
jgi:hypothetical protein